jgi:hypothetical protein
LVNWNEQELTFDDQTSIDAYGKRELKLDTELLAEHLVAANIGKRERAFWKDPQGIVKSIVLKMTLGSRDATAVANILQNTVGDSFNVVDDQLEHDQHYIIIGEHHRYDEGILISTFYLEPLNRYQAWILGTSRLGTETRLW